MIYEGSCTRCGETYQFPSIEKARHRAIFANILCNGLPKRIYEVHDDLSEFQSAMIRRITYPKQQHPLLKFRAYQEPEPTLDWELTPTPTPHRKPKGRWQRWLDGEK